ncbi:hypothetical protein B0T25DRAFT_545941 [Lasiosphaeria hispida]|uniref:Aminoglycoside phosphotransferase domain-containing protein n=1 Tax=Lasiosphaeria hispida TaxID=260671 RepID=A0AAJ0HKF7_9PEZI|nr:hypothetical protein B0T25DRAFT_545941 [Lasiosphaeria hispida]
MGDHLSYDIPRGPFRSSHDWLNVELDIILRHQTALLENSKDQDEREDAEDVLSVARKLLALVPKVFPSALEEPETTALYHHDLHLENILVNEQGEITAVLDWECVSAMPLWMSTKFPKFLEGPVREEEPQRDSYLDMDQLSNKSAVVAGDPDLNNGGKDLLYFIHQMDYEATQLRKVYKAKLKELWLDWLLEKSHAGIDFFQAISGCDGLWVKRIGRWADRIEKGETVRLDMGYA